MHKNYVTLNTSELTAKIGNNASDPPLHNQIINNETKGSESLSTSSWAGLGPRAFNIKNKTFTPVTHLAGYNGFWELSSIHQKNNLFAHPYSGMNYEFLFDGLLDGALRPHNFEPRRTTTELKLLDINKVELYQPPSYYRGLESRWTFTLQEPHYIDLEFKTTTTRNFPFRWYSVFFANYIHNPTHPWMIFETENGIIKKRNRIDPNQNSIVPLNSRPIVTTNNWKEGWLNRDHSFTFTKPYFFARQENMMYQVMIETKGLVGFATPLKTPQFIHFEKFSRNNNFDNAPWDFHNAPWDFHVTYFDITPGNSNILKARVVYKPWDNTDSAKKEYRKWIKSLS